VILDFLWAKKQQFYRETGDFMKLICKCGNEEEFVEPCDSESMFDVEKHAHCIKKNKSFNISHGHDEIFISCKKCEKSIHIFT